ncbi:hypothetical protein NEI00_02760 [Brachyspira pilosicoli]|uniref:hypothetical protein n=1 Tax=Brachyspira pilosicoli TaxID=52584 RepID=UPI002542B4D7|nr:hypothetical protein [Brachyspira pilosicoli]WIH84116.1 hypothetical protein NEI00_02760 [Brachyspira pilosicoli]
MKKLFVLFCAIFLLTSTAFARHGGGAALFVPLTGSFGFTDIRNSDGKKIDTLKSSGAFDFGVLLQPGYFYDFSGLIGVDVLADIGYYRSSYNFRDTANNGNLVSYNFDTLNLGGVARVSILFLSLGIGSGVKLPLQANIQNANNKITYNYDKIKENFYNAYIPYIKFTIDFRYYLNSFSALAAGLYFNYDFNINQKIPNYSRYNISSFDFGFQVGLYLVGSSDY